MNFWGTTELEFERYLGEILSRNPDFSDILIEPVIGEGRHYRPDIIASDRQGNKYVIECRTPSALNKDLLFRAVSQIKKYKEALPGSIPVLAIPLHLPDQFKIILRDEGVHLWDIEFIRRVAETQTGKHERSHTPRAMSFVPSDKPHKEPRAQILLDSLKKCTPGKIDWAIYEKLVGEIIEELFCPDLEKPLLQQSNKSGTNRPDYVLPNYCEKGFWKYARSQYHADYVIADAKNYAQKIKKREVLQVSNYLNEVGPGMLGLIFSRNGADTGADETVRNHWMIYRKLILILNDDDVELMLQNKIAGLNPNDSLALLIQNFRLSF